MTILVPTKLYFVFQLTSVYLLMASRKFLDRLHTFSGCHYQQQQYFDRKDNALPKRHHNSSFKELLLLDVFPGDLIQI